MSSIVKGVPPPGSIGPYRIEARLGKGGMGEVYRAYDERLRRRVAIKHVIARETEKANIRQRFRREARTVASLNHSSIVQIYDILETGEGDWIVMELVEGHTVRELMDQGQLDLDTILKLTSEVAGGLAVAHAQGVVHRDLKVENVMVTEKGHAKILDFGLAKRIEKRDPSDTTLSGAGMVMGTIRAMSPEQIMEEKVDARSDLFSLGTMLYEMCTGQSPFQAATIVATMTQVCRHQQEPAGVLNPEIPTELSELVDRLLEKEPDSRPQDALEVVRFFDRLTGQTTVLPLLEGLTPAADPGPPSHTATEPFSPARRDSSLTPTQTAVPPELGAEVAIRALVATDVAGRAELFERLGEDAAAQALRRLDEVRDQLLSAHAGQVMDIDGLVVLVFERPAMAVEFAVRLHQHTISPGEGAAPRTGVHLGEVALAPDDLDLPTRYSDHGLPEVSTDEVTSDDTRFTALVARSVMALARPGQILLTQAVDELVGRAAVRQALAGEDLVWRDHGVYRLPRVGEEMEIFEIAFAGDEPLGPPVEIGAGEGGGHRRPWRRWLLAAGALVLPAAGLLWLRSCLP